MRRIKETLSCIWLYLIFPILLTNIVAGTSAFFHAYFSKHIFIIPMIEEFSKLLTLFISVPVAVVYTLTFAVIEFFLYVRMMDNLLGGVSLYFIQGRSLCIILHLVCLYIQYLGFRKFKETDNQKFLLYGYLGGTTLHIAWNAGVGLVVLSFITNIF